MNKIMLGFFGVLLLGAELEIARASARDGHNGHKGGSVRPSAMTFLTTSPADPITCAILTAGSRESIEKNGIEETARNVTQALMAEFKKRISQRKGVIDYDELGMFLSVLPAILNNPEFQGPHEKSVFYSMLVSAIAHINKFSEPMRNSTLRRIALWLLRYNNPLVENVMHSSAMTLKNLQDMLSPLKDALAHEEFDLYLALFSQLQVPGDRGILRTELLSDKEADLMDQGFSFDDLRVKLENRPDEAIVVTYQVSYRRGTTVRTLKTDEVLIAPTDPLYNISFKIRAEVTNLPTPGAWDDLPIVSGGHLLEESGQFEKLPLEKKNGEEENAPQSGSGQGGAQKNRDSPQPGQTHDDEWIIDVGKSDDALETSERVVEYTGKFAPKGGDIQGQNEDLILEVGTSDDALETRERVVKYPDQPSKEVQTGPASKPAVKNDAGRKASSRDWATKLKAKLGL